MATQPDYKTTANGTIDYRHYIRRSHVIRSQHAWRTIRAAGNALKAAFGPIRGKSASKSAAGKVSHVKSGVQATPA